jgi:predicted acyltransferase
LGLALIGAALSWLLDPRPDVWALGGCGVLQRIGGIYFVCAVVAKSTRTPVPALALAVILLVAHAASLLVLLGRSEPAFGMPLSRGLIAVVNHALLDGPPPRGGYDPQGVLSSLSAAATGLIGVAVMRHVSRVRLLGEHRTLELPAMAVAMIVVGLGVCGVIPINRSLWTPSYALLCAGLGLLSWIGLTAIWPIVRGEAWAGATSILGRTALTYYLIQTAVIAVLTPKVGGVRIWDHLVAMVGGLGAPTEVASFFWALALMALSFIFLFVLNRSGWLLRL